MGIASSLIKRQIKKTASNTDAVNLPIVNTPVNTRLINRPEKLNTVDADKASTLLDSEDAINDWQAANKIPENKRQKNKEISQQAAEDLYQGNITSKKARKIISEELPITSIYTKDTMPPVPTLTEIAGSLGKKVMKHGVVGVKGFDIPEGTRVGSRLDIPAYNNYDKWVVSIHDGANDAKGSVLGYGQAVRLKNVKFGSESQDALDISRGKARLRGAKKGTDAVEKPMGKATIARIYGDYVPEDPIKLRDKAISLLDDPEWTQVGMNPYRQSQFYDKVTGLPIFDALEVIQVGPLALARGIKKPTISQLKSLAVRTKDGKLRLFNKGGAVTMNNQMQQFAKGGLNDEGGEIDEVSGNKVPIGGTKEGVRDDIPANVSEGEFIFPEDVTRFIGLDKLMSLRQDAKMGLKRMEEMGQMGNGNEATIPDDMPFDMADLIVVGEGEQPMKFADGGFVPSYEPGGAVVGLPGPDETTTEPEESSKPKNTWQDLMGGAYTEMVEYRTANGDKLMVPYINGAPMYPVPDGYTKYVPTGEETTIVTNNPTAAGYDPRDIAVASIVNTNAGNDRSPPEVEYPEPVPWATMSAKDFLDEARTLTGIGRTAMEAATLFMGPLGLLGRAMMNHQDGVVSKVLLARLSNGDFNGLTKEQQDEIIKIGEEIGGEDGKGKGIGSQIIEAVGNALSAGVTAISNALGIESAVKDPKVNNLTNDGGVIKVTPELSESIDTAIKTAQEKGTSIVNADGSISNNLLPPASEVAGTADQVGAGATATCNTSSK